MNRWLVPAALGLALSSVASRLPGASPKTIVTGEAGSDYVTRLEQMERMEAGKGEVIHLLRGEAHGFQGLSFILTETAPGGGPPVHRHTSEEAHVVFAGKVSYFIDGRRFTVSGPYVARVPAGVPHTFMNVGDSEINLAAVFASRTYDFQFVAPNPLQGAGREGAPK